MKLSKFMLFLTFMTICSLPLINYAVAATKPNYCGINEGQTYIWITNFYKDPFQDALEDYGYPESYAENFTDILFDLFDWDEDIVAWKFYIAQIKDEKDMDYMGDEINYVPYLLNRYETENRNSNDWDDIELNEKRTIEEYDTDWYSNDLSLDMGLYLFFVDPDSDWDDLVNEFEKRLEDEDEEGSADVETSYFFFQGEDCGFSTRCEHKYPSVMEEFESVSRYSREGILLYYEWTYDGRTIAKLELEDAFIQQYWWIIAMVSIGAIIAITITITVLLVLKKEKEKEEKFGEIRKEPKIAAPPPIEPVPMVKYCPKCGKQVNLKSNFCTKCGASLKD